MNQVSDAKLAIACYNAGIVPSFFLSRFNNSNLTSKLDLITSKNLSEFRKIVKESNLILSLSCLNLTVETIKLIIDYKVSHIELVDYFPSTNSEKNEYRLYNKIINLLQKNGIKIILKLSTELGTGKYLTADGVIIKSQNGAARIKYHGENIKDLLLSTKRNHPNMPVIVSGGISTSKEIKEYLDAGAEAVSLGTVFALSEESCINIQKKMSLVEMNYNNVTKIKVGNDEQNAIVFSDVVDNDGNNTEGLRVGRDTADKGLIFIGKGIDNINAIKPVSEIVKELTKDVQI